MISFPFFFPDCGGTGSPFTTNGPFEGCDPDQYHCTSGRISGPSDEACVPISWECDGMDDCNDGEDERGKFVSTSLDNG